ncbi:MAG: tRNA1(Val) (adenine(37)-N6)-methyltransferase [Chloroflexota bacterium]
MAFHFKQFSIDDSNCPMKVGTDSVLLGAWTDFSSASTVLDIGTGCGILALMAAQKSTAMITAIEIDTGACMQASGNFKLSPWSDRLLCRNIGLEQFNGLLKNGIKPDAENNAELIFNEGLLVSDKYSTNFDHIITNPPYFINSLKSPVQSRNKARHTDDLPLEVLMEKTASLLANGGRLSIVFPYKESQLLISLASLHNLNLSQKLNIIPKEGKDPNRVLLEFRKGQAEKKVEDNLAIRDRSGVYTQEYRKLTNLFYLHLT